jgi:hypothetical protein
MQQNREHETAIKNRPVWFGYFCKWLFCIGWLKLHMVFWSRNGQVFDMKFRLESAEAGLFFIVRARIAKSVGQRLSM